MRLRGLVLSSVLVAAVAATMPTALPAQESASAGVAVPELRIDGPDRVATSASSAMAAGVSAPSVVVVDADRPALALAAAPLARAAGTVVLLSRTAITDGTQQAVAAVGAREALVVGGADLADAWRAAGVTVDHIPVTGPAPEQLPGQSAAVAGRLLDQVQGDALVIGGVDGQPDLMAAAALADGRPIVLSTAGALSPEIEELLESREEAGTPVRQVTIVGGEAVVGAAVADDLRSRGIAVTRIAGTDRGGTAVAIADRLPGPFQVLLVGEDGLADAAAASGVAVSRDAAVLVAGPAARAWLAARCGTAPAVVAIGGQAVLPDEVVAVHRREARRCDGPDQPMTVRLAIATPGRPGATPAIAEAATSASGWSSRRLQIAVAGQDAHLGILVLPDECAPAAVCRVQHNLIIDADAWDAAGPARRQRLVDVALGTWLGDPVGDRCTETVMDPLVCPDTPISETDRTRVADRFVPVARLAFVGDVHAERHLADRFRRAAAGRAVDNPLALIATLLADADLAVVNLETPLSTRGTPASKTYVFRGPPEVARALVDVGVDVANLANNHALDFGPDALADTITHAGQAGLATVGAGPDAPSAYAPHLVQSPVGTIAVVGLTRVLHTLAWEATATRPGLASAYDVPAAVAAIEAADAAADHVVVVIHWGTERADCPDANQRALAPVLVEAGADLVVGHHPHVLQGIQRLDDALIAYSLGNSVWYHNRAPSRFSGVLTVELPLLGAQPWTFTPAEINAVGSPVPADGPVGASITGRLTDRSPGGPVGCRFPG